MKAFFRRHFTSVEEEEPMTRVLSPDNESECLAKTPTKGDPRQSAPATPTDRFPLGYWYKPGKDTKMDSRSPFRGGGGMQVHAVPDGERATVNGQQLPWAYEYAE